MYSGLFFVCSNILAIYSPMIPKLINIRPVENIIKITMLGQPV